MRSGSSVSVVTASDRLYACVPVRFAASLDTWPFLGVIR
jgi:hypothetical protein